MTPRRTLAEWLAWIEAQHPQAIALGLDRVRAVAARMALGRPARQVVVVAGTNGKGSTVAFIEAIARAAGLRTGAYTSPHLLAYNERVRVDGADVGDDALVEAFEAVEVARARTDGPVALTYFEYGTLAALHLFEQASLDLVVLEVGLGGRLDAVNIVDADVAVVTTVDLDHQAWLGTDREAIGFEKAGIARAWRPLVLGEDDPPASVLRHAYAIGAAAVRAGSDFLVEPVDDGRWRWREPGCVLELPRPALAGQVQLRNAATAIAALRALDVAIDDSAWARGVAAARVPGRLQREDIRGVEVRVDVGHNPQAAAALADWLRGSGGRTLAVYGALADKDAAAVVAALAPVLDGWHLAGLADAEPRGEDVDALAGRLQGTAAADGVRHPDVATALAAAVARAQPGERVLAFGSFHVAAAALRWLRAHGSEADAGRGV